MGNISFFNGIIAGGWADRVDLEVTFTFTTPPGITKDFSQTLHFINRQNTSDPVASADSVYLPTSFPDTTFTVNGEQFTLSIIGFGTILSGGGFSTLDEFNVFEGGSASAQLLGRISRACAAGPGGPKRADITGFGRCGTQSQRSKNPTWGPFGQKGDKGLVADSGEELEIECVPPPIGGDPEFNMLYTYPSAGVYRKIIGKCPWNNGCNIAWFFYSEGKTKDRPGCFLSTRWISKDYGDNDNFSNPWTGLFEPLDNRLDWAEAIFDINTTKLQKTDYKFGYAIDPAGILTLPPVPVTNFCLETPSFSPEIFPPTAQPVDPLLGPETDAFFAQVDQRRLLLLPGEPMEEDVSSDCDLNGDRLCNEADFEIFQAALNKCRVQEGYNPLADANGDGCVTIEDRRYLFCTGDCNGDHSVTVDELATMARILLGTLEFSDAGCRAGDENGDGKINIEEVVTAVTNAITGCPNAPPATQTPTTTPTTTLGPTRTRTPTATRSETPSPTRTAATASPTATTALPGPSSTRTPTLTPTAPTATSTVTPTGSTRVAVSAPVSYLNALLGPDNGARAAASLPASYLNALLGQDDRSRAARSGPVSYLNALPGTALTDGFEAGGYEDR